MFFTTSRDGRAVPLLALLIVALAAVCFHPALVAAQETATAPAAAPKAEGELPSARSIIDRHIKAIGGRDAVLSHTSQHATGTFSVPAQGLVGTVEIFGAANPHRAALKENVAGVG